MHLKVERGGSWGRGRVISLTHILRTQDSHFCWSVLFRCNVLTCTSPLRINVLFWPWFCTKYSPEPSRINSSLCACMFVYLNADILYTISHTIAFVAWNQEVESLNEDGEKTSVRKLHIYLSCSSLLNEIVHISAISCKTEDFWQLLSKPSFPVLKSAKRCQGPTVPLNSNPAAESNYT